MHNKSSLVEDEACDFVVVSITSETKAKPINSTIPNIKSDLFIPSCRKCIQLSKEYDLEKLDPLRSFACVSITSMLR